MIDANRIGADEGGPVKQRRLFTGAQGQVIVADAVGRGSPVLLAHGGGLQRPKQHR